MYVTIHMYDIVHVNVHDIVHTYGTMTWHWLMRCHDSHVRYCPCYCPWYCSHIRNDDVALTDDMALTDEVSWFYWTKFIYTIDWWRGSMLVDQKSHVRYMHIHRIIFNKTASLFKSVDCSNRMVKPYGQTAYCWLITWQNPERPNYF